MFFIVFTFLNILIFICDLKRRIIPNYILLALLLLKTILLVIEFDHILLLDSVLGLFIGFAIFLVPKLLRMSLGWGDVKYSAVLGFCLGVVNYIYGMLTAVILVFLYCAVRIIMKKDIKNFPLPLGSFMSTGVILICIFDFIL